LIGLRRATLRVRRSKISDIFMDARWYAHSLHSHRFGLVWTFDRTFSDSQTPLTVVYWNHTGTAFHSLQHTFKSKPRLEADPDACQTSTKAKWVTESVLEFGTMLL
jgi:hypothetical protein